MANESVVMSYGVRWLVWCGQFFHGTVWVEIIYIYIYIILTVCVRQYCKQKQDMNKEALVKVKWNNSKSRVAVEFSFVIYIILEGLETLMSQYIYIFPSLPYLGLFLVRFLTCSAANWEFSMLFPQFEDKFQGITRKDGARLALPKLMTFYCCLCLFCYCYVCSVLCIMCIACV
jgi:hypothetical protein